VHFVVAKSLPEGEDSKWFALCSPIAGQFAKSVKVQQYDFLLVIFLKNNINYIMRYYLII
jgi:hypothetical protein